MTALFGASQEHPRRFARFGRVMAFIGVAILLLAVSACYQDIDKASFSSWEVEVDFPTEDGPRIIFYDLGSPSRGGSGDIFAYPGSIHVKVLSSLSPGTAVVSGNFQRRSGGSCNYRYEKNCKFIGTITLFVSSQAEADAWNRYFVELVAERERKVREEWGPKKIQPPPTLQKSD